MYISKNISHLRKMNKINQSELARRIGKTPSAISSYEQGKAEPTVGVIMKIAEVFKVSVDELLYKDLTMPQVVSECPTKNMEAYVRDIEEGRKTGEEVLQELSDDDITLMNKLLKRRVRELEEAIREENPELADRLDID
jgi:transcriptional regulator with XRE-family HTH domain